mgnify:CR=1 FL=1
MNKLSAKLAITLAALSVATTTLPATSVLAADTIKVGILHSLSGTMAISETTLKDVMLMLIAEQNKKGGVLGKQLEPVVVDPASNWPLFAEKARELLDVHKVSAVFGNWTSVSRKSVLPVFEELNGILFYPVQYEGEESQRNVIYTGAAPNQQAIPAVDYLLENEEVERWVLAGTDYVYPRTTNKILAAYLKSKGVADEDILHVTVPGALEIPLALQKMADTQQFDALIALGAVIRGETYHFELVSNESGAGITRIGLDYGIPIANAVLTTETDEQAEVRMAEKGADAAKVAVEMANLLLALEELHPEEEEE